MKVLLIAPYLHLQEADERYKRKREDFLPWDDPVSDPTIKRETNMMTSADEARKGFRGPRIYLAYFRLKVAADRTIGSPF